MANLYWVGGTGTWNPASTSWSTTSGGSPGQAAPSQADNAIFDANSGSGTVTIADGPGGSGNPPECASLICTGYTGTIDSSIDLYVNGTAVTLSSGGTYTGLAVLVASISGTCTITSVGKPIKSLFIGTGTPGTIVTLADDLYCGTVGDFGSLILCSGTFNANNKNISCSGFYSFTQGGDRTLNMGSGTWTLFGGTGDSGWMSAGFDDVTSFTVNRNTSTINFTPPASSSVQFSSHNKTYYNLNMGGAGSTLGFQTYVTNIFNTISTSAQPCTLTFYAGRTYTVTNFNASGTAGNLVTLQSSSAGAQFTLSKASGTVSSNYLSIQDSNATGGAAWYAGANSTNVSNNLGWTFSAPPSGASLTIGPGIVIGRGITIG